MINIKSGPIMYIFMFMAIVLVCVGIYLFVLEMMDVPSRKIRKNIMFLTRKADTSPSFIDIAIVKFAKFIEPLFKIDEVKQNKLKSEFKVLEINKTPTEFYSQCVTKGAFVAVFAIPGFFINKIVGILLLILGVIVGVMSYNSVERIIRKRREDIEAELPKFVAVVEQTFKNDRDVIKMLNEYVQEGDTALVKELRIALADMKTGNYETALNRLSSRINSVYLSETVRGLVAALRGEDTTSYFETLNIKLWDNERTRIKKAALKTPSKVKFLVVAMLSCMFIMYIVVFANVIWDSVSIMFENGL